MGRKQNVPELLVSFGFTIRLHRKRLKLSQTELGKQIGVQKTQISKIERGDSNLTVLTMVTIANALDMDLGISLHC